MKKNWKVRFRKNNSTEWKECEKPFQNEQSAMFFAQTIQITTPNIEAEAYEEEV